MTVKYSKKRKLHYEQLECSRIVLVAITLISTAVYLQWRLSTFNHDAWFFSILLYFAEIYGTFTVLMHILIFSRLTVREAPPPKPGISVDVFIPTYNESIEIVRRTAISAVRMDYPHTTYLLDDGRREEVRLLAKQLGCTYLTRDTNEHAKAGNLNYGLEHSTGDIIAIFDADHAPTRHFITRTLGYFENKKVAFVQTPQDFYNLNSFQHRGKSGSNKVWTEQSLFFRVLQRGKDYWNAAFFCGCSALVRRSALKRIGGFATGTITEDLHTSLLLHKAGFTSVYHAESLAYGIAPSQIEPFLKQRRRWGMGAMQVWRKEGIVFCRRLTWAQKINYLASAMTYYDGWQRLLYYISPAIVLYTGVLPIICTTPDFLWHFVPYFVLNLWMFEELARGYGRTLYIEQYNMARFAAFCSATLGWLNLRPKFVVTNKKMRATHSNMFSMIPQFLICIVNLTAIPMGLFYHATGTILTPFSMWANIGWALVNTGMAVSILKFAISCAECRRENYRFSIPVVASLDLRQHPAIGHTQLGAFCDLSAEGGLLSFNEVMHLKTGDDIRGELYLPDGPLPFHVRVQADISMRSDTAGECVGCAFIWNNQSDLHRMEGFLYGSNLEWRVRNISECGTTVLQWLRGKSWEQHALEHSVPVLPVDIMTETAASPKTANVLAFCRPTQSVLINASLDDAPMHARSLMKNGWFSLASSAANENYKTVAASTPYLAPRRDAALSLLAALSFFTYLFMYISPSIAQDDTQVYQALPTQTGDTANMRLAAYVPDPTYDTHAAEAPYTVPQPPAASDTDTAKKKLFISGAEISGNGTAYGMAGVLVPLPGNNQLGNGWVVRGIVDGLGYQYPQSGRTIDARGAGGEAVIGYMDSGAWGWWGAYTGPGLNYTHLSPDDISSRTRGTRVGEDFQLEGERNITGDFKVGVNTVYQAFQSDSYWMRLRTLLRVQDSIYVGPEAIYQGDDYYHQWQAGLVIAGIPLRDGTQLAFTGGVSKTEVKWAPYVGMELGSEFK